MVSWKRPVAEPVERPQQRFVCFFFNVSFAAHCLFWGFLSFCFLLQTRVFVLELRLYWWLMVPIHWLHCNVLWSFHVGSSSLGSWVNVCMEQRVCVCYSHVNVTLSPNRLWWSRTVPAWSPSQAVAVPPASWRAPTPGARRKWRGLKTWQGWSWRRSESCRSSFIGWRSRMRPCATGGARRPPSTEEPAATATLRPTSTKGWPAKGCPTPISRWSTVAIRAAQTLSCPHLRTAAAVRRCLLCQWPTGWRKGMKRRKR